MPPIVALVVAMPMELTPLTRSLSLQKRRDGSGGSWTGHLGARPVVAVVTGMGTALAKAGVERLLDETGEVGRVVVVGITGALDDETPIGTLIRPSVVVDGATGTEYRPDPLGPDPAKGSMWTSDSLITDPATLARLRSEGVVSLDMETAAVGAVCQRRGVSWSVVRAISDRATDGSVDEEVFRLSNQDGTPNGKAVASYFLRHPGRIPGMVRVAKGARLATQRAADAAVSAIAGLDDRSG